MKILMICGVYAEENEQEVLSCTKGYAEQSANIFQRKLIKGIEKNGIKNKVISAPFIGAYPMRYTKCRFRGFSEKTKKYEYVTFNNIWGIRNISRTCSLKKSIKDYLTCETEEEFLILVYCPHTPFLESAVYAKSLKPKSKICLVVPDLPQYMNLNENGRRLYDFFKKYDIHYMERYIAKVDSFVILTEPMKNVLKIGERPYLVVEGIVDSDYNSSNESAHFDGIKRIVYTGKMNVKFGIKELVDSFTKIKDPTYRLVLCGDGDAKNYVIEKSAMDSRIEYKGMVTAEKAKEYICAANVLVNPRPNNEEYTKYSFPSKNIEYLMTGKPVVAYMLDGMPDYYMDFLYTIPPKMQSFESVIVEACERVSPKSDFRKYATEKLFDWRIVNAIMSING